MTGLPPGIALRPIAEQDFPFLRELYASTRIEELAPMPWPAEAKAAFLAQQFELQHRHYTQHYQAADFLLILSTIQPIGRLYLHRTPQAINVIDIALLPAFKRRGIGTALLAALLRQATDGQLAVELYVEANNPAYRLYQRLGFHLVEHGDVYDFLRWSPTQSTAPGGVS